MYLEDQPDLEEHQHLLRVAAGSVSEGTFLTIAVEMISLQASWLQSQLFKMEGATFSITEVLT